MSLIERHFHAMGTEVGVFIGAPHGERLPSAESMAEEVESELLDFDRRPLLSGICGCPTFSR